MKIKHNNTELNQLKTFILNNNNMNQKIMIYALYKHLLITLL